MPACPPTSESHARRTSALRSALGPVLPYLEDPRVVEVMLNADGVIWVDKLGQGMFRTPAVMLAPDAERMLRLVASEVLVELNAQSPSLSAKLPAPWGARLQAAIPPIVDAPVFALRMALVLWTSVGAFAFGLHQVWLLPVGIGAHVAAAAATKADPYIFEVILLALKTQKRLDP